MISLFILSFKEIMRIVTKSCININNKRIPSIVKRLIAIKSELPKTNGKMFSIINMLETTTNGNENK